MRLNAFLTVIAMVTLSCHASLTLGEEDAKKITVQFLGEDEKPIKDCHFCMIDWGEKFQVPIIRDLKMNAEARTTLDTLPKRFLMSVWSDSTFYSQDWLGFAPKPDRRTPPYPQEIFLHPGENIIRLKLTGKVSLSFTKLGEGVQNPLRVVYYRKSAEGKYVDAGGIGIFLGSGGMPFEISGLPPGEYMFALRKSHRIEDAITENGVKTFPPDDPKDDYWSIRDVKIEEEEVTYLKDLIAEVKP